MFLTLTIQDDSERQNFKYLREVISQNLANKNAFQHHLKKDSLSLTEDIGKVSFSLKRQANSYGF
jgi:hypothetical protein